MVNTREEYYGNLTKLEWSTTGLHQHVLDLLKDDSGTAVDLACGSGNMGMLLTDKGFDVTCVDIEDFRHSELKQDTKFIKSNLNNDFKIDSNSIDVVVAMEIIEHLENPRHFIRECKRIVKPNGKIIITTPEVDGIKQRIYFAIKGIIYGFRQLDYELSGHITPMTKYDFERIAKEEAIGLKLSKFNDNLVSVLIKQ